MEKMDRLRDAITDYIRNKGVEYQRLLVSKEFHTALQKEAEENDTIVDLPRLEVKENADYDFKLLP